MKLNQINRRTCRNAKLPVYERCKVLMTFFFKKSVTGNVCVKSRAIKYPVQTN